MLCTTNNTKAQVILKVKIKIPTLFKVSEKGKKKEKLGRKQQPKIFLNKRVQQYAF